jgi:cytochrome c peroxidase
MPLIRIHGAIPIFAVLTLPAVSADIATPMLPTVPYHYADTANETADYAALDNMPAENPVTDDGATLGRVIFYDRNLSANGLVSCASCHTQATAFDDHTRRSIGFRGKITDRAAMPLNNARYNPRLRYFRDERAATLEEQVLVPFTDLIEMGLRPGELVERVAGRPFYGALFSAAFGGATITENRIASALAQFVRSITANRSRYDLARKKYDNPLDPFASFTPQENRGKEIFFGSLASGGGGCASCHVTDAFLMIEPRNNGVDDGSPDDDPGIGGISGKESDLGLFRAASLKNVALTAPYMHDGRFADLEAVIEHYDSGVRRHPNLSDELRDASGEPARLGLSASDKAALVAFLETLTDDNVISNPRYSDPFRRSVRTTDEE